VSLLDLHGPDLTAASPRFIQPQRPTPEAKFSAWSAIPRALGEAAAQRLGGVADVIGGFGQVAGAYPEAMGVIPDSAQLQQAEQQRQKLLRDGVDMSSEVGDTLRDRGREFRVEPEAASTAEQLIYGFTRAASKVVTDVAMMGPAGALVSGGDEALSVADDLKRQGVTDPLVRGGAGAVQGAGLALAALPLVGQSLTTTAALYVAGGPGGFVAQQAMTRKILADSGYAAPAAQFDPFDPVGLAVASLIPAGFAALGVRGQRLRAAEDFRAGPAPSGETATAAAVRQAYGPEVADAARVLYAVEQRNASSQLPGTLRGNDAHQTALARAEDALSRGDAVHVADLVPPRRIEGLAEFMAREKIKAEPIPPEVNGGFIGWIARMGGIDFAQKWDITNERGGVLANPGGIFRRSGLGVDDLALQAEAAGYLRPGEGSESSAFVDLVQQAVRGEKVLTLEEQMAKAGRDSFMESLGARIEAAEARLKLLGVDPSPAGSNVAAMESYLRANEPRLLGAAMDEITAARDAAPEYEALVERARLVADDIRESDRTLASYEAEIEPLSPVMRRLVEQEIKATSVPREAPTPVAPDVAVPRQPADGASPAPSAETAAALSRIAQIERDFPGLTVRMDGDATARPLSEFMAAIKAEADEMEADAPLMQVAAECALINGAR
jgi:hypothetical protein